MTVLYSINQERTRAAGASTTFHNNGLPFDDNCHVASFQVNLIIPKWIIKYNSWNRSLLFYCCLFIKCCTVGLNKTFKYCTNVNALDIRLRVYKDFVTS